MPQNLPYLLVPLIVSEPTQSPDFPVKKCFRSNVCPCRVADIKCCEFCKCEVSGQCNKPHNTIIKSHDDSKDRHGDLLVDVC